MPQTNRLFSKSMNGKILNFSHGVEKVISVGYIQESKKRIFFL